MVCHLCRLNWNVVASAGEDENQILVMQDKQVTISKTTVSGDEVTGALMQIKDEDGNIIDEWTSEGKVHYATGLVEDVYKRQGIEREDDDVEIKDSSEKPYKSIYIEPTKEIIVDRDTRVC